MVYLSFIWFFLYFQGRIFYHCAGTKLTKKCNFWRWASKDEMEREKAKENEENGELVNSVVLEILVHRQLCIILG